MSIRSALGSLPSKPGIVLAVVVIIIVLSTFYYSQYRSCTDIATLRSTIYDAIQREPYKTINLASITPFTWQKVRVIINHQTKGKVMDCPFDWDWSQKQRKQLMAEGKLNVLAFARKKGNTVVDFDKDMVDFDITETVYMPESAIFEIDRQEGQEDGFILSQLK